MSVMAASAANIFSNFLMIIEVLDDEHFEYDNVLEEHMFIIPRRILRERWTQDYENIIDSYNNEQFKSHFRMSRSTFEYLLHLVEPSIIRIKNGNKTISPQKQILIAIWKMATPDSYRSICEKFGVGQATALASVRKVTKAIAELSSQFITWPQRERVGEIMTGFAAINSFPGVIGAIDGTHINIKAPNQNPECYVNRKGHHSIQLQAVCDHERRFTHCFAGHVGSVHDQRVFRLSEVHGFLANPQKFPNDTHLVGDAAYCLHNHLMVPYRDNGHLSNRQKNFNYCLSSTRMVVERSFALLKGRFRSLLTTLDMNRTDLIPQYIIACCTLHNICLLRNDELPELNLAINNEVEDIPGPGRNENTGNEKRDFICNNLLL